MLNRAICKNYERPAILYGSKVWCLKESEIGFFMKDRKIHGGSNVWSAFHERRKI